MLENTGVKGYPWRKFGGDFCLKDHSQMFGLTVTLSCGAYVVLCCVQKMNNSVFNCSCDSGKTRQS